LILKAPKITGADKKKIIKGKETAIILTGTNLVGAVVLSKKGQKDSEAELIQVFSNNKEFSDLKKIKVTFKTDQPVGKGYTLIISNVGGTDEVKDFEIVE